MKRRLLTLLLALVFLLALIPGTMAWDGETDWQDAYRAFLLEDGFRKTGRTYSDSADYPIRFSLYDLDGYFRPELLLRDPMRAMAQEPYDVYTVRNGNEVDYIGRIGIRGGTLHYAPGRGYDGVFSYDGSLGYYTGWYYTMADGTLVTQRVMEAEIENDTITETWVTADAGLKKAFSAAYDGPVTNYTSKGTLPSFSIKGCFPCRQLRRRAFYRHSDEGLVCLQRRLGRGAEDRPRHRAGRLHAGRRLHARADGHVPLAAHGRAGGGRRERLCRRGREELLRRGRRLGDGGGRDEGRFQNALCPERRNHAWSGRDAAVASGRGAGAGVGEPLHRRTRPAL